MTGGDLSPAALVATGISKRYGGVQALDRADLTVGRAEIHALIGENGAGKSTLAKVIAGLVSPESGELRVNGELQELRSPADAKRVGIATVHQELSLIPELSVAQNLVLSDPPTHGGLIAVGASERLAERALGRLGADNIDPRRPVGQLPLDQQQIVEIAKAMMISPNILILDEATSSLGDAEVQRLFTLVRSLNEDGTTIIVITHRMREIWELATSMTVLRDGHSVGRFAIGEIDQVRAVSLMAGRDIRTAFPEKPARVHNGVALELRNVQLRRDQPPWSLQVREGEILGVGGLQGQGQREFLMWLYGSSDGVGTITRNGVPLRIHGPSDALRNGIVLIPEERASGGLHLELPVRWNLAMATLKRRSRFGVMDLSAERQFSDDLIDELEIKLGSPFDPVSSLSGGTQQKVVLGKFLSREPSVLLFLDPTRGIDVKTKFEIYEMLRRLAGEGAACLLYSSDTEELVGLCDRIAVFHDGVPAALLEGDTVTAEGVVSASFAIVKEDG